MTEVVGFPTERPAVGDAGVARIAWREGDAAHSLPWFSPAGAPVPRRVNAVDDRLTADAAFRLAAEGTALLWRGDFQNARQLLQALARRLERKAQASRRKAASPVFPEDFHRYRMAQAQRARILGMLLVPVDAGYVVSLRRAPDVRSACEEAGAPDAPHAIPLRELQGLIGAHEWRKKGVPVPAVGGRIHPYHGVFSPVRGEYVDLVATAPLPAALAGQSLAFDVGTGTGVLAVVLARRGLRRLVATDQDARALACARDNVARLGLSAIIEVCAADLFPASGEQAPLIVCNPPWLPGKPASPIEHAIYDPDSRMLRAFLSSLRAHLAPGGEGWLILSDLAEHLRLRSRDELLAWIGAAGLRVLGRLDARPVHGKAFDAGDPLHAARAAELTSLWRFAAS